MQISPIQQSQPPLSKQNFKGTLDKSVYQYAKKVEKQFNNKTFFPRNPELKLTLQGTLNYLKNYATRSLSPDSKLKLAVKPSNIAGRTEDVLLLYATNNQKKDPQILSSRIVFKDEPLFYPFYEATKDLGNIF